MVPLRGGTSEQEVGLRLANSRKSSHLDVRAALQAICSRGRGRCWHCDRKLPAAAEAIGTGWHLQRLEGAQVASIILLCPKCRRRQAEVGRKGFLRNLSPPVCHAVQ
jgi:hypothetical protein